jgi:hypothetical protein
VRRFLECTFWDACHCFSQSILDLKRKRWYFNFFTFLRGAWLTVVMCSSQYKSITFHQIHIYGCRIIQTWRGSLNAPFHTCRGLGFGFSHVERDSLTQQATVVTQNILSSTSRGHWWVRWSFAHKLHRHFAFHLSVLLPPELLVGFLSPLPFLHCFLFPSGYWVAFGFVDCTLCTSDVWVGGATETVVWLDVVCCIDNCCNCFFSCSTRFVCAEPTIPLACGPSLCLVLSSMDRGASKKISYSKPD